MKARDAHQLVVGDFVVTAFSNSHRKAQIGSIDWPHFRMITTLASGEVREEVRLYRSLFTVSEYEQLHGKIPTR